MQIIEQTNLELRDKLKQATSRVHDEVEQSGLMRQILEGTALTDAQYICFLHMQIHIYGVLEKRICAGLSGSLLRDRLIKTEWIEHDLESLGQTIDASDLAQLAPLAPSLNTYAKALGGLYVLEGSTMGLKVIKLLLKNLPAAQLANRFINAYGKEHNAKWKSFVTTLNQTPVEYHQEVAQAALDSFAFVRFCAYRTQSTTA